MSVLTLMEDPRHMLFVDRGRRLQIFVRGDIDDRHLRLLTETCISLNRLERHLLLVRRLSHLAESQCLPPALYPSITPSRRLGLVLSALDGWLAGLSQREIGLRLFGRSRIDADWNHPSRNLADRVRRAVRRGTFLMGDGYLRLLR